MNSAKGHDRCHVTQQLLYSAAVPCRKMVWVAGFATACSILLTACFSQEPTLEEALSVLDKGPLAWNRWRVQVGIAPIITGEDFSDRDFEGIDFSSMILWFCDLSRANLQSADLYDVDLTGVNLTEANLSFADLSRVNLFGADLTRANLQGANLELAFNWHAMDSVAGCNIYGLQNAPSGFRTWALSRGAVETDLSQPQE